MPLARPLLLSGATALAGTDPQRGPSPTPRGLWSAFGGRPEGTEKGKPLRVPRGWHPGVLHEGSDPLETPSLLQTRLLGAVSFSPRESALRPRPAPYLLWNRAVLWPGGPAVVPLEACGPKRPQAEEEEEDSQPAPRSPRQKQQLERRRRLAGPCSLCLRSGVCEKCQNAAVSRSLRRR